MSAVDIQNVTKVFKKEAAQIVALQETSLRIREGEFLCLMGPSGSGKSTLLNLVAGIDRPSAGQIVIGGTDISKMSEGQLAVWRNHTIGFIFQTFNLIPVLTAFENVELPLLLTRLSKAERREHVETALSLVLLERSHDALPAPAFRRAGTARRDCARRRVRPHILALRRADWRSRPQERG